MSKDLFLKIREEDYLRIPEDVRRSHLTSKIYAESVQDFDLLMRDANYRSAYAKHKEAKKELEEITYRLREERRKTT